MTIATIDSVYSNDLAGGPKEQYDEWAQTYERDNASMGYKLYSESAAVFANLVPLDSSPILDAGCGTGVPVETLFRIGYRGFIGVDISEEMMQIASQKNIYTDVMEMNLSQKLSFDDNKFAATLCSGVVTPGHAPASVYREFLRVTRADGFVVFSMRCDTQCPVDYQQEINQLVHVGRCHIALETPEFTSFPFGDSNIKHKIIALKVSR
jgi:SAM-dependent methyltransferase